MYGSLTMFVLLAALGQTDLKFDFRNSKFDAEIFPYERKDAGNFVSPEAAGLRITAPTGIANSQPIGVKVNAPFQGNFEATFSYEILSGDKGDNKAGPGPQFYLMLASPERDGIAFGRQIRGNGEHLMTVVHLADAVTDQGKSRKTQHYRQAFTAADVLTGKMRFVRQGTELLSQFAEGNGPFQDVGQFPIGTAEVRMLRIAADPNGRRAIDLRILDFELKFGDAKVSVVAPPPPTPQRSYQRLYWAIAVFVLFLLAAGGGLGWRWFRRR